MFSHIPSLFEPSLRERCTMKADSFSSRSFLPRTICVALLGALSMQSVLAQGAPVAASNHGVTKQVQPGNALPVAPGAAKDLQGEDPLEALLASVATATPVSASKAASIAASTSTSKPTPTPASASKERVPSVRVAAGRDAKNGMQQDAAPQVQPVVPPAAASARPVVDRRAALLAAAERQQQLRKEMNPSGDVSRANRQEIASARDVIMPAAPRPAAATPDVMRTSTSAPASTSTRMTTRMNEVGAAASVLRPSSTMTSTDAIETITLSLGQGHLMEVGQVLRIALGSGRVLQANWLDDRQLLLIPEAPGETTLHLWLKGGGIRKYQILVTESNSVRLAQDMNLLLGENSGVRARALGDRILLEGQNPTEEGAWRAAELVKRYPQVISLVSRRGYEQMINLEVKMIEIGRNALKQLGVRWQGGGAGDWAVSGPSFGVIGDFKRSGAFLPEGGAAATRGFAVAPRIHPFATSASMVSSLSSMIDLMVQNGDAAVLAEPRLSTRSGGKARFVAGGELPIPVLSANGAANVDFKEYGVRFEVEPVVNAQGVISASLHTEVSSIDDEVTVMGVPGLRKQSSNTDVNLRPGETLVIAGMVRNEMSGAITKIPGLGDLPILGHLFRSKRFRQRESEMVVLITPRLSEQGSAPAVDPRVQALQQRADALKKQFDMLD
jgi:type II and III secretion system protein